jgi:uncharacterized membrane protein
MNQSWAASLRVVITLVWLTYPLVIFFGLRHWGFVTTAMVLVGWSVVIATLRIGLARRVGAFVIPPFAVALLALLGAAQRESLYMLAWPVGVNLALLAAFSISLMPRRTPIAEQFARRFGRDHLSPARIDYCRGVTLAWVGFFACNALVTALIAIHGSLELWALYTGVLSYIAIGLFFAIEFLLRTVKFRHSTD